MATATIAQLTAQTNPPAASLVEIDDAGQSRKSTLAEILKNTAATTSQRGSVLKATANSDLTLTITDPPTQAEVQAIHDKLNALQGVLRTAGILT